MTVSIGPGWSIGAGVALGAGGGSSTVTYTAGVDWDAGATSVGWDASENFLITGAPWTNIPAFLSVIAQPPGTVYTCNAPGVTNGTITTTGPWSGGGGFDFVSATGANGFAAGTGATLTSITFTPA